MVGLEGADAQCLHRLGPDEPVHVGEAAPKARDLLPNSSAGATSRRAAQQVVQRSDRDDGPRVLALETLVVANTIERHVDAIGALLNHPIGHVEALVKGDKLARRLLQLARRVPQPLVNHRLVRPQKIRAKPEVFKQQTFVKGQESTHCHSNLPFRRRELLPSSLTREKRRKRPKTTLWQQRGTRETPNAKRVPHSGVKSAIVPPTRTSPGAIRVTIVYITRWNVSKQCFPRAIAVVNVGWMLPPREEC